MDKAIWEGDERMSIFDRFKKNESQETPKGSAAVQSSGKGVIESADNIDDLTQQIIMEIDAIPRQTDTIMLPIAELKSLGTAGALLLPAFRTITQTTAVNMNGVFRLANASIGDTLKQAKDGNFWGAYKKAGGGSKFAKLTQAGPLNATSTTVVPIDPAMIMIVAALYTIEKKLDSIVEKQKQILSFLETEKKSQIEADVKMLAGTMKEFKFNWDKELFITGHYKLALDVKRTAEKNLQSYQKELQDIKVNTPVVIKANVDATVKLLLEKFSYYRMSLYLFSMSSFIEVMLLGDFREEHILKIKGDINERSMRYRQIYDTCSAYIEKIVGNSIEVNVLKGIGAAGKAIGGLIGSIPFVKDGPVDEWLQDSGESLNINARGMETDSIKALAAVGNPDTGVFTEKLDALNQINNHTSGICFDKDSIYLLAG